MSDDPSSARLTELETLVTFQEETINAISDVVAGQQETISEFERRLRHLEQKLREVDIGGGTDLASPEPPPPHY